MRLVKRIFKIVGIVLGALVAIAVIGLVSAKLYFNDERLAGLVTHELNDLFAGHLAARDIHWQLPFHLTLDDVAIDDPAGRPAIRVTRLEADFVWRRFLAHTIAIDEITAHGVDVRVLEMPDHPEQLGIVQAFMPKTPSAASPPADNAPAFDLDFRGPILDRVEFTYEAGGMSVVVNGGRLEDVTFGILGDVMHIDGHVSAEKLATVLPGFRYSGPADVRVKNADVDMGLSGQPSDVTIKADDTHTELDSVTVAARGELVFPMHEVVPRGTLVVDATLPLEHPLLASLLAPLLPPGKNTRGVVTLHADAKRNGDATDLDATIKGDNAVVASLPVDDVAFTGRLEPTRIEISRMAVVLDGGQVSTSGELSLTPPMAHDVTVDLEKFPLARVVDAWVSDLPLPARLSGRLRAHGEALLDIETHVAGELRSEDCPRELAGLPDPLTADIDADIGRTHANVQRLTVRGDGARLDVEGRIPFDMTGRIDASLALVHKQPNATLDAAGTTAPISLGELSLVAKASGTRTNLVADAMVDGKQVIAHGWGPADIHLPLHVEGGVATVTNANITLGRGGIAVSGSVGVFDERGRTRQDMPLHASVKAHDLNLAALSKQQASGTVALEGDIDGTLQAPRGRLHLGIANLAAHGVDFARAEATVALSPDVVELQDIALAPKNGGDLDGKARYTLSTEAIDATLDVHALPLTAVLALAAPHLTLRGTIGAHVHVGGTVSEPDAKGHVSISDFGTGMTTLGALNADIDDDHDDATRAVQLHAVVELAGPLGNAKVDGHYTPRTKAVRGTIAVKNVSIATALAAAKQSLPIAGNVGIDATVDGTLPYPGVTGEVDVTSLVIDGEKPETDSISIKLSSDARDTSYAADIAFGRMLTASVRAWPHHRPQVSDGFAAEVDARFEELRISAFSPRLTRAGFDVQLSGETVMRYAAPNRFDGRITLNWLEAIFADQKIATTHYVIITLDGENVDIPKLDLAGSGSTLSVTGSLKNRALSADVDGDLNIAVLAPFVTAVSDPSGVLHVNATARGNLDAPRMQGEVTVAKEVRAQPHGIPQELVLKSGRLVLTPDNVGIEDLRGALEDGTFRIDGHVGLTAFKPSSYALTLEGEHLSFQNRELQVEADAKLQLTGTGLIPDVKGHVVVVTGRYLKKFALKDFNFVGKRPDTSVPLSQTAPWLSQMHLDLRVTNSEDFDVDVDASAFAVQLPLQVDMTIHGTPLSPHIGGRVTAQSGSIKFPYATLNVQETFVTFTPGLPPSDGANLTLVAEGEVPSNGSDSTIDEVYLVTMNLSGTLSQLNFDLSASPGLDRNQTLALLVTGKAGFDQLFYGTGTPSGATGTASGNSSSPEVDAAIALAGAGLTGPLTGFVENQLEDRLNLKIDLSASVTSDQLNVTARKELTPRLRLEGSVQRALQATGNNLNVATATFVLGNRWFLQALAQAAQTSASTATDPAIIRPRSDSRVALKYRLIGD